MTALQPFYTVLKFHFIVIMRELTFYCNHEIAKELSFYFYFILFYFYNSKDGGSHYIDRTEWNQTLELMLLLKEKKKSFQHSSLVVSNFPSELNNSR